MSVNSKIETVLHDQFGVDDFRPGQEEVIRAVLRGRDVFARMPTGSGKSLCFQLPAVMEPEQTTLVISPLIALMRDQVRGLVERGISATDFNSGYEPNQRGKILREIHEGVFRLVYVAPEQLALPDFRTATEGVNVSRIVVDEAHCISQWGHDFRPSYRNIEPFATERGIGQILAFTATASKRVIRDVERSLGMEKPFEYLGNILRPNLEYRVVHTQKLKEKARILLAVIREHLKKKGGIVVYCATRNEVLRVYDFLHRMQMPVTFYHAGMPKEDRKQTEKDFFDNTKRIMVATNAFGMGVDKPDIHLIVHFNIPGNIESYIQETGRAGRDGKKSICLLIYYPRDRRTQEDLQNVYKPQMQFMRYIYNLLYAQAKRSEKNEEGFFEYRFAELQSTVDRNKHGRRNRMLSSAPMINAALSCMQEFGILEIQGRKMKLHAFAQEGVIDQYITERKQWDETKLENMVTYAESEDPNQELLIELLEKDK